MRHAQAGDTVLLVSDSDRKRFIRTLEPGRTLQTHRGLLAHNDLIGQPLGSQVRTHVGFPFFMLIPTTDELIRNLRRESQIIFPKDAGYIIMKLGVQPGWRVIEAGTGSGGLCVALATIVGNTGHVYSYDSREPMQEIGRQNITRYALESRVTFTFKDVREGFDQEDVDALFLDVREPQRLLDQARAALRGSGVLGCIVPTVNQLVELLDALQSRRGFAFVEAEEVLLRSYKTLPVRVRPEDRMVGHTGFLVFARAIVMPERADERWPIPPTPPEYDNEDDQDRQL